MAYTTGISVKMRSFDAAFKLMVVEYAEISTNGGEMTHDVITCVRAHLSKIIRAALE